MNFLHQEFDLDSGDAVQVELDHAANVKLLDSSNFYHYQRGEAHRYYGGFVKVSPFVIRAPHAGHWHVTIDLGGYAGCVRAGLAVLRNVA